MEATNIQKFRKIITIIASFSCIGFGILSIYFFHNYKVVIQKKINNLSNKLLIENDRLTNLVKEQTQALINSIQDSIHSNLCQKKDLELFTSQLKTFLVNNNQIDEINIVTLHHTKTDEFSPETHIVYKKEAELINTQSIDLETTKTLDWYKKSLSSNNSFWGTPFYTDTVKKSLIHWVFPIIQENRNTHIISVLLNLDFLEKIITDAHLESQTNVCFFTSDNIQIYHSFEWLKHKHQTLHKLVQLIDNNAWQLFWGKQHSKQVEFVTDYTNIFNPVRLITSKIIDKLEWKSCLTYESSDMFFLQKDVLRTCYIGLLCFLFMILALLALVTIAARKQQKIVYTLIGTAVIILASFICLLWFMQGKIRKIDADRTEVYSQREVDSFLKLVLPQDDVTRPTSIFNKVPTGIWVEHAHLIQEGTIELGGIIWQRYTTEEAKKITEYPCSFEQALVGKINEIFRYNIDNETIIGWRFFSNFRFSPNFIDYPFDQQTVDLWFKPLSIIKPTVYTPDFIYQPKTSDKIVGLTPEMTLSNWQIEQSNFSYETKTIPNFDRQYKKVPELVLSINLKRNSLNILTGFLLPLLINYFVLFVLLIVTALFDNRRESLISHISLGAALLLATVIPHSSLRSALNLSSSYAEKFYFLSYAFIIFVLINCILYNQKKGGFFITYKNNLIPILLFWPMLLLFIALITFSSFAM